MRTADPDLDNLEQATPDRPAHRGWAVRGAVVLLTVAVAAGVFVAGVAVGGGRVDDSPADDLSRREFMFEVTGVATPNQGGQTLNLFFQYRYDRGIAERDIPDYRKLRADALGFLTTTDLSSDPYWETLNRDLCARLKAAYPIDAISCQLQVVGNEAPGRYEPGYHASIETIGDIDPLRVPGPSATS